MLINGPDATDPENGGYWLSMCGSVTDKMMDLSQTPPQPCPPASMMQAGAEHAKGCPLASAMASAPS